MAISLKQISEFLDNTPLRHEIVYIDKPSTLSYRVAKTKNKILHVRNKKTMIFEVIDNEKLKININPSGKSCSYARMFYANKLSSRLLIATMLYGNTKLKLGSWKCDMYAIWYDCELSFKDSSLSFEQFKDIFSELEEVLDLLPIISYCLEPDKDDKMEMLENYISRNSIESFDKKLINIYKEEDEFARI